MNCWAVPLEMVAFTGVTAMDTRVAEVTVKVVEPETLPRLALMVVFPTPAAELSPSVPAALEMVATNFTDEAQVTEVVRSWVELSL